MQQCVGRGFFCLSVQIAYTACISKCVLTILTVTVFVGEIDLGCFAGAFTDFEVLSFLDAGEAGTESAKQLAAVFV